MTFGNQWKHSPHIQPWREQFILHVRYVHALFHEGTQYSCGFDLPDEDKTDDGIVLQENLAVEIAGSIFNSGFYSDLATELLDFEQLAPQEVDLKQMEHFAAISLQYSALYGKLNFYDVAIDYDVYVTGGFGFVTTLETCDVIADAAAGCTGGEHLPGRSLWRPADFSDGFKIAGNLGLGLRAYFYDFLGVRFEVRDIVYSDRKVGSQSAPGSVTTDIRNNLMLFLGASVML